MNREKGTIKNNSSVPQIFKLFIQLKGDICNRWREGVCWYTAQVQRQFNLSTQYTLVWYT